MLFLTVNVHVISIMEIPKLLKRRRPAPVLLPETIGEGSKIKSRDYYGGSNRCYKSKKYRYHKNKKSLEKISGREFWFVLTIFFYILYIN